MQHDLSDVSADAEVVEITVKLGVVTCAAGVLIHGGEFDVGLRDEVVDSGGRHVQDTVFRRAVTIVEVVTQTELHLGMHEIAYLGIAPQ